ncbi:MAG: arylsulfotransferase family protein, partial [Bacteroidota bacterium]
HLNSVDYQPEWDQIVVSSRKFSEVWVIDHSTTAAEAATNQGGRSGQGGALLYRFGNPAAWQQPGEQQLFSQHDARWLPQPSGETAISVFNNAYASNTSAISTWTLPVSAQGVYESTTDWLTPTDINHATGAETVYSPFMSSAQALPNGHYLLCVGNQGRLLEWNAAGEVVWEYLNPVNSQGNAAAQGATARQNQTFRATKYLPDFPAFQNRVLIGTTPVELNPDSSNCFVPPLVIVSSANEVSLAPNPATTSITLTSTATQALPYQCYSTAGRLLGSGTLAPQQDTRLSLTDWPRGLYILWLFQPSGKVLAKRFIKG